MSFAQVFLLRPFGQVAAGWPRAGAGVCEFNALAESECCKKLRVCFNFPYWQAMVQSRSSRQIPGLVPH